MVSKSVLSFGPAVAAALALSGCMSSGGGTNPDWRLNDYLPDPAINTASQQTPLRDQSFQTEINGVRTRNGGFQPLSWNAQLDDAAQSYAGYLYATDQFSHTAGNSTIGERVTATGYQWRKVGENLGQGYADEKAMIAGWEASPGHKANQNDPDFEEFGLGVSGTGSKKTWVLVLADPL